MSKKWGLKEEEGSMSIEACAIIPMFLFVILIVMKVGFYSHDVTYINSIIYQWGCNSQTYELTNEQLKEYIGMEIQDGTFGEVEYELTLEEKNGVRGISIKGEVHGFYFEHQSYFSLDGIETAVQRIRGISGL
ncbi:MAG: hypothetical protein IJA10_00625 [Lachnospiraceae bacterium]|nr:hypothetical protein [Lachnospiraceae bacterium]